MPHSNDIEDREIMWMLPDLAKDEQWDSTKPTPKGKFCNIVSVLPDDDNITVASLSVSKDEKIQQCLGYNA